MGGRSRAEIHCKTYIKFWGYSRAWWRTPLIPALGRQSRWISEFEASLVYIVSSRAARATQRNPVLKKKKAIKLYRLNFMLGLFSTIAMIWLILKIL